MKASLPTCERVGEHDFDPPAVQVCFRKEQIKGNLGQCDLALILYFLHDSEQCPDLKYWDFIGIFYF